MNVVVTDLDGTLLDRRGYSWEPARPALEVLRSQTVPVVVCTSKTRAEVEYWRERLALDAPFIVENGGAAYVPQGYFRSPVPGAVSRGGYEVIEFGDPYDDLVRVLAAASRQSGCPVIGFHDMSVAEICVRTRLPVAQAELAKAREYDEPFEVLGPFQHELLRAIEAAGKSWTRGGRFHHITGRNDKSEAVRRLLALYRKEHGSVTAIGLGDSWNDVGFLKTVDIPVVVRSEIADRVVKGVPKAVVTAAPGPAGWNEAILECFDGRTSAAGRPPSGNDHHAHGAL